MVQMPQSCLDPDFEGLASDAELYIFNQDDSQEQACVYYFGYLMAYVVQNIYVYITMHQLGNQLLVIINKYDYDEMHNNNNDTYFQLLASSSLGRSR